MKIAFFDSGIGGMTVLHQAIRQMPDEDYLYFADTDHVPYGTKTAEEIVEYVEEAVAFIMAQDVKALVVACNTATSVAIETLRCRYTIPILGMEPAVKPAVCSLRQQTHQRVLVAATPITLREQKMQHLLAQWDQKHLVDLLPLPELVRFAERGNFVSNDVSAYLQQAFAPLDLEDYGTLVLGCTHFNLFKDTLRSLLPVGVQIIDGNKGTVCHLQHVLAEKGLREQNRGQISFYASQRAITETTELARYRYLLERLDDMLTI